MKQKRVFLPIVFIFFFLIGSVTFYFFGQDIMNQFFKKDANVPGGAISKNEPVVTCGAGDKTCESKNNKVLANRLEGPSAKFVSHQCDGPRACPTPTEDEEKVIISAIRAFVKDSQLELIPINGVTPTGMIYYCAEDNRCWSYDTKSKKVALLDSYSASPTATEEGAINQ